MNSEARKYFKELRFFIPIPGKQGKKFIKNTQRNMEDYLSDHPSASYDEICNHFGTPKEIACNYLEITDDDYLIQKIRVAALVKRTIFCVIIFVIVVCMIKIGWYYREFQDIENSIGGYFEEVIE